MPQLISLGKRSSRKEGPDLEARLAPKMETPPREIVGNVHVLHAGRSAKAISKHLTKSYLSFKDAWMYADHFVPQLKPCWLRNVNKHTLKAAQGAPGVGHWLYTLPTHGHLDRCQDWHGQAWMQCAQGIGTHGAWSTQRVWAWSAQPKRPLWWGCSGDLWAAWLPRALCHHGLAPHPPTQGTEVRARLPPNAWCSVDDCFQRTICAHLRHSAGHASPDVSGMLSHHTSCWQSQGSWSQRLTTE